MRVLFVPIPIISHFMPQVPLAWALRAAGHDVRVAALNSAILGPIASSGLTSVRVGGEFDSLTNTARGLSLESLSPSERQRQNEERLDVYAKATEEVARDLLDFARWWKADLVVADPLASMAPLVTETLGIPLVRHLITIDVMRHMRFPGTGAPVTGEVRDTWPARLLDLYDRYGVEAKADYAVRTVDPCPSSVQFPGVPNRLPMQYVPYNGSGVMPAWLTRAPDRPRVAVTWGTVTSDLRGPESFQVPAICRVLTGLGAECVVAIRGDDRKLMGPPVDGVRIVDSLPFHLLFPSCTAFFHQGGGSSMLTAALSALPQVIWPQIPDHGMNADLMSAVGAAIGMSPREAGLAELESAAERVLTDESLRAGAVRLREEILAQPTPAEVARTLQDLVRTPVPV